MSFRSSFDLTSSFDLDLWIRYADRLPLNIQSSSITRPPIPDYLTLDARLAWRPHHGVELSVVGQHLLQSRHVEFEQEVLGPPRSYVPRGAYVQFDWRF
ncbi:hypothetical protein [Methylomagnum sp.]